MHPKMATGYAGYGKGSIVIPFPEAINTFRWKMVLKLCSMPLYDVRGQLYEYTIYETFNYRTTRYKRNSVYDSTRISTKKKVNNT